MILSVSICFFRQNLKSVTTLTVDLKKKANIFLFQITYSSN